MNPKSAVELQSLGLSANSQAETFEAEGMGFEPTTPFGAPDFETPEKRESIEDNRRADKKVDRTPVNNCQNAAFAEAQIARINELLTALDANDLDLLEAFLERVCR